jgi:hypothetical protein
MGQALMHLELLPVRFVVPVPKPQHFVFSPVEKLFQSSIFHVPVAENFIPAAPFLVSVALSDGKNACGGECGPC